MKALIVVMMGGVGNLLGAPDRGAGRSGSAETCVARLYRSRPDAGGELRAVPRACCWCARPACSAGRRDEPSRPQSGDAAVAGGACARWPSVPLPCRRLLPRARHQPAAIHACWRPPGRCSPGPTRYVSLATVAFFGIGAYTVAVLGESAALAAGALIAAVLGVASRCRRSASRRCACSGVYFVIFTFGLAELVRQLVIWFEVNITAHRSAATSSSTSRQSHIYWQLLALTVLVFLHGLADPRARASASRCASSARTKPSPAMSAINTTCAKLIAVRDQRRLHDAWPARSWRRAGPISTRRSPSTR